MYSIYRNILSQVLKLQVRLKYTKHSLYFLGNHIVVELNLTVHVNENLCGHTTYLSTYKYMYSQMQIR